MRRLTFVLILVIAATAAKASDFHFSVRGEQCSPRNFQWDGATTYVEEETIAGTGLSSIKASVTHSPVSVTGGSSGYSIDVCKAATSRSDLDRIRVTADGGELRATGPDNRRWTVIYRIRVPHNANVEIEAKNGPVSFADVEGTIVARSTNGPLSLHNVSGNVDVITTNGPISVNGGSGTFKVHASNGPLSVNLDGHSWVGGSLDATTRNGPLSLKIPRGYGSGVVVESNGRSPISCRAEGCDGQRFARRSGDTSDGWSDNDPRRIELGQGRESVHLSTINGPVTIKDDVD
jgi:hypothetical protein